MIGEIELMSVEQVSSLLTLKRRRRISSIHIHHTYRPTVGDWRGEESVAAIRRYHVEVNGWSDLAQHLTVGPDGSVWSGRHIDRAPASATGFNGTSSDGPLMIEMVGNFDTGYDRFTGVQADTVIDLVARVCAVCGLDALGVRFHREMNGHKTCPGTSIDLDDFRARVAARLVPRTSRSNGSRHTVGRVDAGNIRPALQDAMEDAHGEPSYDIIDPTSEARGPFGDSFSDENRRLFRKHVVNLSAGRLSSGGDASSSPEQIDDILAELTGWLSAGRQNRRVMLYAHGGLVSEKSALSNIVVNDTPWWLANGVYPVFFVWETGLTEVYSPEEARGRRGVSEAIVELLARETVGKRAWTLMKDSARNASAPDLDDGRSGGAYQFAQKLLAALSAWRTSHTDSRDRVGLHMLAHSAGSIFAAYFLPMLRSLGLQDGVDSLTFMAPAIRIDLFKAKIVPILNDGWVTAFAQFGMTREAELSDRLVGPVYNRSLLYLVRNGCEDGEPPILGLAESLEPDDELRRLFTPGQAQGGRADLILSPTEGVFVGRYASHATRHGDFDDDPHTMNSVLRRILGLTDDAQELPSPHTSEVRKGRPEQEGFVNINAAHTLAARPLHAHKLLRAAAHALCIGIDEYPAPHRLAGCVADAGQWASALRGHGVTVHEQLLNHQATKRGIIAAWRMLYSTARPGDTVVIQFSGHGTQVRARNPREERDGMDEAWVPFDYEQGELLVDDEIAALIDSAPPDVQVVLFTDCCHSGTNTRAKQLPASARSLAHDVRIRLLPLAEESAPIQAYRRLEPHWSRELPRGTREPESLGPEVHFAGCLDDQFSYESAGQGDFTRIALRVLAECRGRQQTYASVFDLIRSRFGTGARQSPSLRARPLMARLPLFGSAGSTSNSASRPSDGGAERDASVVAGILVRIEERLARLETILDDLR